MSVSTTNRHSRILMTLSNSVVGLMRTREAYALQKGCNLVYSNQGVKSLIDVSAIKDTKTFREETMNNLDYVQPDFILFNGNWRLCNLEDTKIAGCPNLIVEVWSPEDTKEERDFKFNLYSSSPTTEHWYINQDSDFVKCYYGADHISVQKISNVLIAMCGVQFDLRYLFTYGVREV